MTDPQTSELQPSSILPDLPGVESSPIDQNLQSIRHVEKTWRLPALPDQVKLDLASHPALNPTGISQFLHGIDSDMFAPGQQDPTNLMNQGAPGLVPVNNVAPYQTLQQDAFTQATTMFNTLRNLPPADVLDMNAVQRFKMDAISSGMMTAPADGKVDGSWSPELASMQRNMQFEAQDKAYRGDRFGAMATGGPGGVLDLLNTWTSPSGLFRAAIDMDLFWDFGQIGKEFSSWGDKWQKVGNSDGILDFGKNLFDAMTGPIDDIVVPALNLALLFSGLGAGANFARLGMLGAAEGAAESFSFASKLYQIPLVSKVFPSLNTVEKATEAVQGLSEASMTANRLMKGSGIGSKLGEGMAAWRDLPAVVASKRFTQTGMRLGFVSQAEDKFLPSYKGRGLGDIGSVASNADRIFKNPVSSTLGEILLMPYTIFEPGTFVDGAKSLAAHGFQFLGTTPGRAVAGAVLGAGVGTLTGDGSIGDVLEGAAIGGALGAAAPVVGKVLGKAGELGITVPGRTKLHQVPLLSKSLGYIGDFLEHTSYLPVGDDERLTNVFYRAMKQKMVDDPEGWAAFDAKARQDGFLTAFRDHQATDEEGTGAAMSWLLLTSAMDHTAALQARSVGSDGWRHRYWIARNKLAAQVRVFDPATTTKEELVWAMVSKDSGRGVGSKKAFEAAMNDSGITDANLAELVGLHNDQARLTMKQLVSHDNLPVAGLGAKEQFNLRGITGAGEGDAKLAAMTDYIAGTLDSFGQWGVYSGQTTALRGHIGAGMFGNARILAPNYGGRKLNIIDSMEEMSQVNHADQAEWSEGLRTTIFKPEGVPIEQYRKAGGYYNPLAREIDPSRSRFTLAKMGTKSKQDYVVAGHRVQGVSDMFDAWREASRIADRDNQLVVAGGKIGSLSDHEMTAYLKGLGFGEETLTGSPGQIIKKLADSDPAGHASSLTDTLHTAQIGDTITVPGASALEGKIVKVENGGENITVELADGSQHSFGEQVRAEMADKGHDWNVVTADPMDPTVVSKISVNPKNKQIIALRRLNRLARSHGLSVDTAFEHQLQTFMAEFSADPRLVEEYGLAKMFAGKDGRALSGMALLKAQAKALRSEATYRAAEIDMPHLIEQVRASHGEDAAKELEQFVEHTEGQGYKVVYGADFLHPDEVLHQTGLFTDINERHMNAMTLGNFFGRKQPEELRRNVQRARQLGIAQELTRARGGAPVGPDDPDVTYALQHLYEFVLRPQLDVNNQITDNLGHQGWIHRGVTSVRNSYVPRTLTDLGLGGNKSTVMSALVKVGYSDRDAIAVWQGIKAGRYAEFKDMGIAAVEAKLRGNNQVLGMLHVLGGTDEGLRLHNLGKGKAVGMGALTGFLAGQASSDQGDSSARVFTNAMMGAGVGAAGGALVGEAARALMPAMDYGKWSRWGYMADELANLRDKARFTLSPFFDISRYSHSFYLNQALTPRRLEDGSRIALPLNSSPKALERRFMKEFMAGGASRAEAENRASAKFSALTEEFRQSGHQAADLSGADLDPDAIDKASQFFQDVGILSYNPTRWMTGTFHNLREAGLDSATAHKAVIEMYHYGTTGRSAAEQSVNFIFFPFSFQKKVIMSTAGWLADDMSRAVLLHDGYKAFELLDKRYDLSAWAEDHLPMLHQLERWNMFAFGLSPGRLGGLNAPLWNAAIGNPFDRRADHRGLVFNLFGAVGADASGPGAIDALKDLAHKMTPAINDLNYMLDDIKSQGDVMFSKNHQTEAADTRDGYAAWGEFKKGIDQALVSKGAKFSDMMNNTGMAPLKAMYYRKKLDLESQYPGWVASKERAVVKNAVLDVEREQRLGEVLYHPDQATPVDAAFYEMERLLGNLKGRFASPNQYGLKQQLESQGITDWADTPPDLMDKIRGYAVQQSVKTKGFEMVYNKFYAPIFGPITSKITAN